MKDLNLNKAVSLLNNILEYELAGVVKYTHFALMVTGPNRLILDKFFKGQASESLDHAQQAGELYVVYLSLTMNLTCRHISCNAKIQRVIKI